MHYISASTCTEVRHTHGGMELTHTPVFAPDASTLRLQVIWPVIFQWMHRVLCLCKSRLLLLGNEFDAATHDSEETRLIQCEASVSYTRTQHATRPAFRRDAAVTLRTHQ